MTACATAARSRAKTAPVSPYGLVRSTSASASSTPLGLRRRRRGRRAPGRRAPRRGAGCARVGDLDERRPAEPALLARPAVAARIFTLGVGLAGARASRREARPRALVDDGAHEVPEVGRRRPSRSSRCASTSRSRTCGQIDRGMYARDAAEHFCPWNSYAPRTSATASASTSADGCAKTKSLPPVSPTRRG